VVQAKAGSGYICTANGLGSGLPTFTGSSTLTAADAGTAGSSVTATLATLQITLPPQISALLPALKDVGLSASDAVNGTSVKSISPTGQSGPIAAGATTLPAITATATLPLSTAGTVLLGTPGQFTLSLVGASTGTSIGSIACGTATLTDITIKVASPAPPPPSGPRYTCTISGGGSPITQTAPIPMAVTVAGSNKTGSTDSVTLSSPSNGLGAPYPKGTSSIAFSGSLPVTGAQTGSVQLHRATTHLYSVFRVTGSLFLTKPGTDHIYFPQRFTFTLHGPANTVPIVLNCSLKGRPGPVAASVKVTGAPTSAAPSPAAVGVTPTGAPATGGGAGTGVDVALAAAGAAGLAAGTGLVLIALRRRKGHQPAT
jgi:hypothetical protein